MQLWSVRPAQNGRAGVMRAHLRAALRALRPPPRLCGPDRGSPCFYSCCPVQGAALQPGHFSQARSAEGPQGRRKCAALAPPGRCKMRERNACHSRRGGELSLTRGLGVRGGLCGARGTPLLPPCWNCKRDRPDPPRGRGQRPPD
jgi:hypothetical protein